MHEDMKKMSLIQNMKKLHEANKDVSKEKISLDRHTQGMKRKNTGA